LPPYVLDDRMLVEVCALVISMLSNNIIAIYFVEYIL